MTRASIVRSLFDADASLVLRDIADGAETSTATEPGVRLPLVNTPYWAASDAVPGDAFAIDVQVDAIDADGGTVVLAFLVDDRQDMSDSPAVVANLPITTTGVYRVAFDRRTLADLDVDISTGSKWIAARATLAGGGGNELVSYGATITRLL